MQACRLFFDAMSGSRVVTAEGENFAVGSHILYDAASQPPEVVTTRVHEVHAGNEHAVEPPPEPPGAPPYGLVLPVIETAKQALKRESLGLLLVKAIRKPLQLFESRDLLLENALGFAGRDIVHPSEKSIQIKESSQAVRLVVVVDVEEGSE